MRTLEDWFKYLEQQYVDEKEQKESKPSPEQVSPKQQTAQAEPVTGSAATPAVQEPKRAETVREHPPSKPPVLEQVQVTDVSVPDPADYIFTLRRPASEPAEMVTAPAAPEIRSEEPVGAETEQPVALSAPVSAPERQEPLAEESTEVGAEGSAGAAAEPMPSEAIAGKTERPQRAKPVRRAPYTRSVRPVPPPQSIEELWKRVPRHVRLLVELGDDEVTQKYYDRQFKESRQELVERLLNPSLTLEDTARLLGVCPTTVRRYTERGLLNHYRTPGNQRRFRLSDVIAFLEARQQAQEARRRKR